MGRCRKILAGNRKKSDRIPKIRPNLGILRVFPNAFYCHVKMTAPSLR